MAPLTAAAFNYDQTSYVITPSVRKYRLVKPPSMSFKQKIRRETGDPTLIDASHSYLKEWETAMLTIMGESLCLEKNRKVWALAGVNSHKKLKKKNSRFDCMT